MRASTAAVVSITTLFVVGCAQGPSPTVASGVTAATSAQLGPGASYDGSGSWHYIATDRHTGDPIGNPFDVTLTQDSDGNLSGTVQSLVSLSLTRHGNGPKITYSLSAFGATTVPCQVDLRGTLQIDTTSNTGNGSLRGT